MLDHYAEVLPKPVTIDNGAIQKTGTKVVQRDLLVAGNLICHDPDKLRIAVLEELHSGMKR